MMAGGSKGFLKPCKATDRDGTHVAISHIARLRIVCSALDMRDTQAWCLDGSLDTAHCPYCAAACSIMFTFTFTFTSTFAYRGGTRGEPGRVASHQGHELHHKHEAVEPHTIAAIIRFCEVV
jgi:hypothetical protein